MTAVDLIAAAGQLGLTLRAKGNGNLGFKPERLCPPEFKAKLKTHKAELLALLQAKSVTWIEVNSERIGETIFFCADEDTRNVLVEAGAEEWSIYTKDELRVLVAQNRIAPLCADNYGKSMRSNGRSTGGSSSEAHLFCTQKS